MKKQTQFGDLAGRQPGADCATQTQFPAGEVSRHSTIPSFHHSSLRRLCKTKPNLGRMGHLGGQCTGGQSYKTKPISATMPIGRSAFPGPGVQNKANFGELAGWPPRAGCANKANWQNSIVRNKANSRTDSGGQGPAGLRGPTVGTVVQTNPVCHGDRDRRGQARPGTRPLAMGNRAKQSQFSGRQDEVQVLDRKMVMIPLSLRRACAKQSQFSGPG